MGQTAAKQGDLVTATDIHIQLAPGSPLVPTPVPSPFSGTLLGNLSTDVNIEGMPAATVGSTALNQPPHFPTLGPFQVPPSNRGTVQTGSATVSINGKPAARNGDTALTCNDPADLPLGTVQAVGTVDIGG